MIHMISQAEALNAFYMTKALMEAQKARDINEVPVGAVIVQNGTVISRGHNKSITLNDPTAHAEIIALRYAAKHLKNYRLKGCTLYVTLEPCAMCAGALVWARISKIVFGAYDAKAGGCGSVVHVADNKRLNHRIQIRGGVLEKRCGSLIRQFFKDKRG